MIARNKYVAHRNKTRAEQAWEDYRAGLSAMFPHQEVARLTDAKALERHEARWKRIEAAEGRLLGRSRSLHEDDIE